MVEKVADITYIDGSKSLKEFFIKIVYILLRSGKSSAGKQSQQKNLQRKKNIQDLVWHFYPNVDFENFFKTMVKLLILWAGFWLQYLNNFSAVWFSDKILTGNVEQYQRWNAANWYKGHWWHWYLVFFNFPIQNFLRGADGSSEILQEFLKNYERVLMGIAFEILKNSLSRWLELIFKFKEVLWLNWSQTVVL